MILDRRPRDPTTTTSFGDCTSGEPNMRCMASRKMEKHSASRKTPLMSAPRISALCQPYEYLFERVVCSASWRVGIVQVVYRGREQECQRKQRNCQHLSTSGRILSEKQLKTNLESVESYYERADVVEHVERVRHER